MIVLGVWGALIPFIGPYFHYAFGSFQSWHYTSERLWLDILPGAAAVIGGLMLLRGSRRTTGLIGGWLAVAAGAWFAIGPTISLLWHQAGNPIGAPMGGHTRQALEWLGYFQGLGVLIAALAAFAMGRYFSRPRVVAEPVVAAPVGEPVAATRVEEPVATRDAPVATRVEEPVAARDAPVATRVEEPWPRATLPWARARTRQPRRRPRRTAGAPGCRACSAASGLRASIDKTLSMWPAICSRGIPATGADTSVSAHRVPRSGTRW